VVHGRGEFGTCKNNRGEVQAWATAELLAELEPNVTQGDQAADLGQVEELAELRLALTESLFYHGMLDSTEENDGG
jgi:predicted ATPase